MLTNAPELDQLITEFSALRREQPGEPLLEQPTNPFTELVVQWINYHRLARTRAAV
jgi:hypothetical protein